MENLTIWLQALPAATGEKLTRLFLAPASSASLLSLAVAFCIAALFLVRRRPAGRPPLKPRALLRALLPARILKSRSTRTDIGFFLFNSFLYAGLFGWAVLSGGAVREAVGGGLEALFGGPLAVAPPAWLVLAIATPILFLAAEFSYWLIHYLLHRVPFLWAFHQVHHSAEVLTPATNFRVHPVETIAFANLLAVVMGTTNAVLDQLLGGPADPMVVGGRNGLALVAFYLLAHLQHSHMWITFPGWLGRTFYSPAHHQIHHSTNPAHFGTNLGSFVLLWDRLFGTHYPPPATRPRDLTFGVEPIAAAQQTITGALLTPFADAWRTLRPPAPAPEPAAEPAPVRS